MIDRREVITGGVLGSVMGALGGETVAAQSSGSSSSSSSAVTALAERALERIADVLGELRAEVRNQRAFTEIAAVRDAQKTFLRANNKLPDFIEVGVDVWYNVYDWHIRWLQQPVVGRDALNRLTIALNQTIVVMRTEVDRNFVGGAYDNR